MSKWIKLAQDWELLPISNGIELRHGEKSLDLEVPTNEEVSELKSALKGDVDLTTSSNPDILSLVDHLLSESAIEVVEIKPTQYSKSSEEKILCSLRSSFVGSDSYIKAVYRPDPRNLSFPLLTSHIFSAKYADSAGNEDWSSGLDDSKSLAEIKAIMEGLERVASGILPTNDVLYTTGKSLGPKVLDPRRVVEYSTEQYRHVQLKTFSLTKHYYWQKVFRVSDSQAFYLPVECIYYPISQRFTPNVYTYANSSGIAAGLNFESALFEALTELIERDAFMLTWINRLVHTKISKAHLTDSQKARVTNVNTAGYEVEIVNITLDLLPTVLVVAHSTKLKPSLILGMSCKPTVSAAISKALSEVEQQLYWKLRQGQELYSIDNQTMVSTISDHSAIYVSGKHLHEAEFLWSGTDSTRFLEGDGRYDQLDTVLELLNTRNIETYALDLSPFAMKSSGVYVVRAIAEGLVPISFGYGLEPLAMKRLKSVPEKLGLKINSWQDGVFTHPFA